MQDDFPKLREENATSREEIGTLHGWVAELLPLKARVEELNTQVKQLEGHDSASLILLIERGLSCLEQGYFAEGAVLFRLARSQLFSDQIPMCATLDAVSEAIKNYLQAQQALQEASKRFAVSDTEQQIQVEALKILLPTLVEGTQPMPSAGTQSGKKAREKQALRLLRPSVLMAERPRERQVAVSANYNALPALYITCFGHFEIRRSDPSGQPIQLCNNLKGQAILRYLVAQTRHQETIDRLMVTLWPEESCETAQHKLRIAISALRCSLNKDFVDEPGGGYILCRDRVYQLNPAVVLHSDVDDFLACYQAGLEAHGGTAAALFERACHLYVGVFLVEDLYTEWSFMQREELSKIYVVMCNKLAEFNLESGDYEAAVKWASTILKVDRCDEEAHRQLIRAYAVQGRRSEALRQYQRCQRVLDEELGVQPMVETQRLLQKLMNSIDFSNY